MSSKHNAFHNINAFETWRERIKYKINQIHYHYAIYVTLCENFVYIEKKYL